MPKPLPRKRGPSRWPLLCLSLCLALSAGLAPPPARGQTAPALPPGASAAEASLYRSAFSAERLGQPLPGPGIATGFTMLYRGAVPHAAFAAAQLPDGRGAWALASGQASPAAAEEEALRLCRQSLESLRGGRMDGECRIIAVDGRVGGEALVTPRQGAIGPFTLSPLHLFRGPDAAAGVVVWAHGYGGAGRDLRRSPAPGFLSALNNAGWDVLRFDRHPGDDALHQSLPRLIEALPLLRPYPRVVLAGHSRGGWQALLAAAQAPALVDGVLATAPAAHGELEEGERSALALEDFRRHLSALPRDRVRVLIALFEEDSFDPNPAARAAALTGLGRSAPTLVLFPDSPALRGHHGASDWRFTRDYAACVLSFFHGPEAAAPRGLRRRGCGGG
ncbi:MAG: alpha/beta hydrolase-fold protein [Rhodovarius sp.]|nr:alpha/beta hydrolase-fold protein [Rhodovarius sp.]